MPLGGALLVFKQYLIPNRDVLLEDLFISVKTKVVTEHTNKIDSFRNQSPFLISKSFRG